MIGKSVGGAQQSQMGLCTPAQSRSPWTPPWATLGSLVEMRPRTEPPAGPGAPRLDSFAANMTDDSTIYPLEVLIVCVHIVDMGEFCERQGNTRGVRVDRIGCFQAPPRFACAQQECSSVSRGNPRTSQSFGTFHRALTGRVGRGRRLALRIWRILSHALCIGVHLIDTVLDGADASRRYRRLESRLNPQAGKPALHSDDMLVGRSSVALRGGWTGSGDFSAFAARRGAAPARRRPVPR